MTTDFILLPNWIKKEQKATKQKPKQSTDILFLTIQGRLCPLRNYNLQKIDLQFLQQFSSKRWHQIVVENYWLIGTQGK